MSVIITWFLLTVVLSLLGLFRACEEKSVNKILL